ncbi:hypothetical protein K8Z08_23095, partial [Escherichia coli]
ALTFQNHTDCPLTDFGGKTSIFSHPVYLFLRKFSLQDSRGGSLRHIISALRNFLINNLGSQRIVFQLLIDFCALFITDFLPFIDNILTVPPGIPIAPCQKSETALH